MSDYDYEWLYVPGPDDCENLEGYQIGGYHPVEIGDRFCDGKYTIVHKLGAGNAATVWLAQVAKPDRNTYVALKILSANVSKDDYNELRLQQHLQKQVQAGHDLSSVALLLDSLWSESPNGKHLCLVYEPAGPSLSMIRHNRMKISPSVARELGLKIAQALKQLHDAGVVYGDLGANNVLLRLVDIDSWTTEELYGRFGHPEPDEIQTADGRPLDDHAPKSVYYSLRFLDHIEYLKPEIAFVDLAEGRLTTEPREKASGWSVQYTAPETLWFQEMQDQMSDIWALACIWFEIRSAEVLFEAAYRGPEGIQTNIIETIGDIPAAWRERLPTQGHIQEESFPVVTENPAIHEISFEQEQSQSIRSMKSRLRKAWIWIVALFRKQEPISDPESPPVEPEDEHFPEDFQPEEPDLVDESLRAKVDRIGTWHEWFTLSLEERVARKKEYSEEDFGHITTADVDDEPPPAPLLHDEKPDFVDLLSSVLKYEKSDRTCLKDILAHPWFSKQYGKAVDEAWLKEYSLYWAPTVFVTLD